MSNDLVERLRVGSIWGQSVQDTLIDWMKERKQAADRIDELEANINIKADFIDATINQLAASDQRIKELEAKLDDKEAECRHLRGQAGLLKAKLAKAVEMISLCRKMQAQVAHTEDPLMVLIDTTLAELKVPQ
jgi:septal ring factor EnvC (AmiA/AmiB activator)